MRHLSLGLGLKAVKRGSSNTLPNNGTPTLVLDFVGTDPTYSNTLGLDFTTGTYGSYTADPVAPAYAAFYVWS